MTMEDTGASAEPTGLPMNGAASVSAVPVGIPSAEKVGAHREFLEQCALYFEKRPTGGEDMEHWSNVFNAKHCREMAVSLGQLGRVVEALQIIANPDWTWATPDAMRDVAAQGMAARSGETAGLDPKGNSPVAESDAPNTTGAA